MTYFDWLVLTVAPDHRQRDHHTKLLFALYSTEFYWVIKRDRNRAEDGLALRNEYERRTGLYAEVYGPCNCLEMFVSMALRCENELMYNYDPDSGNQTDRWFWMMIDNLGLDYFDDNHFDINRVDKILDRFMNRRYGLNYEYCPFPVTDFVPDFENLELSYQMNYYIRENYY